MKNCTATQRADTQTDKVSKNDVVSAFAQARHQHNANGSTAADQCDKQKTNAPNFDGRGIGKICDV